jgi:sialate O-acetylesterase
MLSRRLTFLLTIAVALSLAAGCMAADAPTAAAAAPAAQVRLPRIFGSHMVLQQGIDVPVWGWTDAGAAVTVTLGDAAQKAVAGADGRWSVRFGPLKAGGGPLTMTVTGANTITLTDILVGEVWVGSGQSNMEMSVGSSNNAAEEAAAATDSEIRFFTVPRRVSQKPLDDLAGGQWEACTPDTVRGFSAAAYFFGRRLRKDLGVPVGLIHTSWGGTPAEAWTTRPTLESDPDYAPILDRFKTSGPDYEKARAEYERKLKAWEQTAADPGNKGFGEGWADPATDVSAWKAMDLPAAMESQADLNIDGAVWFRREVAIPDAWAGKDLLLELGSVDDFDVTYFDNVQVGATGQDTPLWWAVPRKYTVPGRLVKGGKAVVAVRVFDHWNTGGIVGQGGTMRIAPAGSPDSGAVGLAGPWRYKVEFAVDTSKRGPRPSEPMGPDHPHSPAGLWNAMIRPIVPFAIRGAIWYQGETNAGRAYQYRKLFPAMITDWRKAWGQGDFTFLFVQLANFTARKDEPDESEWAELREAQSMTLGLPKTGQAVIIDIGDAVDIHPKNKQDVGLRLALAAEAIAYGKGIVYSGPAYKGLKIDGGKAVLTFEHIGGGLVAKGGKLTGFAVAGADRKFVWADAKIEGDTVVVSSDKVAAPVAVRYAWANNPDCNLYNKAGLPASPFRTDQWPGVTISNK